MLGDLAERRREELAAMPEGLGERIRALEAYDFLEPEARTEFQALLEQLRGQVLDAHLDGLSDADPQHVTRGPRGEPGHGPRAQSAAPGAARRR